MTDFNRLPPALAPYADAIRATEKPVAEMTLTPADDLSLWESHVGGNPYLPLTESYPLDSEGVPLSLLIQINFAQMPPLPDYPRSGILQIYHAGDDLYGADFDNPQEQNDFRVLYFPEITEDPAQLHQDFSAVQAAREDENYFSPVTGQYRISFTPSVQYISTGDTAFGRTIFNRDELYDFEDEYEGEDFYEEWVEPYDEHFPGEGHHVGGYPAFTQSDPREYRDELKPYVLLLQLDSGSGDVDILWGDCGIGNFFIRPEDLKKADFSRVVYNWDCT
ncbi:TPA: YwqG family protein [Morganella morganii]